MVSQERKPGSFIKERLINEFYRFSFYKAVSLLEGLLPDRKPLGHTLNPQEETVRFSVKPGFAFPPSDISSLKQPDNDGPFEMDISFMGLIGPAGVLPHWYNELAVERVHEKDNTFISFLDIFHHRLISLFYLAWKRYRVPENYLSGAKDRLSGYLLSLIGLGTPCMADRIGLPEDALVFYSGFLSREVPSVVAIEAAIGYFADTGVQVEQFIERFIPIDPEDCTYVGSANNRLGMDIVCGNSVLENRTKFRINLGPMGYKQFVRFLPAGDMMRPIFSLAGYMAGKEYEFDIRLFLKRPEVPLCTVGMETSMSPRLGWSTWLTTPGAMLEEDPWITFQVSDV